MASSVVVKATAPFRSFLNQRFGDLHERMQNLENQVNKTLAIVEQQSKDTVELQRALLDAMTLLASVVAESKAPVEQQSSAEQKAPAAGPVE